MAKGVAVLGEAIRAAAGTAPACDRELLERFASGEEAAFAALFRRHGGMVLGVCRRALRNLQDAEDACQATFLLLSRKAASGRWQPSVANWLYLTARRVARNARVVARRRARHEGRAAVPEAFQPVDRMTGRELLELLDAELDRLPPTYREPLVLCYLEGLTRDEAAARLGLLSTTLKSRLERGRKRLGQALARRGCVAGAGLLALAATSPAGTSPPRLAESVLAAAAGRVAPSVAALARSAGAVRCALALTVTLLGAAVLGLGAAWLPPGSASPPAEAPAAPAPAAPVRSARTFSGRVLDPDGNPIGGARLMLCAIGPAESRTPVEAARTAEDGTFRCSIQPPEDGKVENRILSARAPGFAADWAGVSELAPDKPVTFRLVPDDITVRGRVVDLEGKPVVGATVSVQSVFATTPAALAAQFGRWRAGGVNDNEPRAPGKEIRVPEAVGVPAKLVANGDGRFEIKGAGSGRMLNLNIHGKGIATAVARVAVLAGTVPGPAPHAGAETRLSLTERSSAPALYGPEFTHAAKPDAVIKGVVTDAKTGKPLAGIQVSGSVDNSWWEIHTSTRTDADGRYVLTGVAKAAVRRVWLWPGVDSPYLEAGREVRDTPGLAETIADFRLTRGVVVTARVTDKVTGEPAPGAAIFYTPLAGNPYFDKTPDTRIYRWSLGATGAKHDGTYRFVAFPGVGLVTAQGEVCGGKGTNRYLQVRLDPADEPRVLPDVRAGLGDAFLGANGIIFPLHNQSAYKIINPAEGTGAMYLGLEFEPGKSTAGKVLDPDGKSAAGVLAYGLDIARTGSRELTVDQALKNGTFTANALEPKWPRTVTFLDRSRKLAGAARLTGDEKEPAVVKLGCWGVLTGRVLDVNGQPCAGITVKQFPIGDSSFDGYRLVTDRFEATSDAGGRFRLDMPFGGIALRLGFLRDGRSLRTYGQAPEVLGFMQGDSKSLGDTTVKTE